MPKFRKKPVVIEAIQWTDPGSVDEIINNNAFVDMSFSFTGGVFKIFTLEGEHVASLYDWIIRGVAGEFYPCKATIFAATYEAV